MNFFQSIFDDYFTFIWAYSYLVVLENDTYKFYVGFTYAKNEREAKDIAEYRAIRYIEESRLNTKKDTILMIRVSNLLNWINKNDAIAAMENAKVSPENREVTESNL